MSDGEIPTGQGVPEQRPAMPVHQHNWPVGTRPTVSVVCAAFNQRAFIEQCLDSLLAQVTDFPVEIIVHDDASTDGTAAVVESYARRYPKVVKAVLQTENQHSRQRKARPIMLSHARGEFVADCDGDDMWVDPHKLTKQVGFLRDHPSFVLSFHNAVLMTEDGRMLDYFALPKTAQRDYSSAELRVLQWGFMLMGTVVHRNVGLDFPPEYSLAPNGDNFVPMLLAPFGGAKFQPEVEPLARRLRKGSMWASKSQAEKDRMLLQTYLQIASYFVRIGEVEAATTILMGRLSSYVGRYLGVVPLPRSRRRNALPPTLQTPSSNGRRERRAARRGDLPGHDRS